MHGGLFNSSNTSRHFLTIVGFNNTSYTQIEIHTLYTVNGKAANCAEFAKITALQALTGIYSILFKSANGQNNGLSTMLCNC